MDRLFLDANVLFSAAHSAAAGVRRLWSLPEVRLLSSAYAVEEARRNLKEPDQRRRLEELLAGVEVSPSVTLDWTPPKGVELPDKDVPIMAGAVLAGATHLITGDVRHFGSYFGRTISGVLVLPPAGYPGRP